VDSPDRVKERAWAGTLRYVALRTLTRLGAAAAGTLLVVGCSESSEGPDTVPPDKRAPASSEMPEPVPSDTPEADVQLRLAAGASSAQAQFDAPDPRTHMQTIEVDVEPAESPVVIDFMTTTGSTLHVLGPERHNCSPEDDRITCIVRFPILEAQRSGRWTVAASKADGPPTDVVVHVRWEAVDPV
jgi:hypothetical protein